MTTDTGAKEVRLVERPGHFTVGGMAKGAAHAGPEHGHDAGRPHHRRRRQARHASPSALPAAVATSFNSLLGRRLHLDQRHRVVLGLGPGGPATRAGAFDAA